MGVGGEGSDGPAGADVTVIVPPSVAARMSVAEPAANRSASASGSVTDAAPSAAPLNRIVPSVARPVKLPEAPPIAR